MRATIFNLALFLDRLAATAPLRMYALGGFLLASKLPGLAAAIPPPLPSLAALAALLSALIQAIPGKTRRFTAAYALAWLDLHNRAGGSVIAGQAPPPTGVRPGLSPTHLLKCLAWPALFLLAAWLAPAPEASVGISGAGLAPEIARLEREVAAAEPETLAQPDAESLRRQLERLRDLAENNPEAAAEALSLLPGRLRTAQAERRERLAEALDRIDAAASQPDRGRDRDETLAEMFQALEQLAQYEGGPDKLPPELREAWRQTLSEAGAASSERPAGASPQPYPPSRETLEELRRALERQEGRMAEFGAGGRAGGGGAGREPGEAPLVFGGGPPDGGRFRYHPLPPGEASEPKQRLRLERIAPSAALPPEEFRPIWRRAVDAPGRVFAGTGTAALGPERARAVERYFSKLGEDVE
ncbi:MAG: hypothetical protein LBU23_10185 [Planctomycetota bacterium]|jgi:hypothetical protein|nr:hypothetical protein [Planctomycetota bacterium]